MKLDVQVQGQWKMGLVACYFVKIWRLTEVVGGERRDDAGGERRDDAGGVRRNDEDSSSATKNRLPWTPIDR